MNVRQDGLVLDPLFSELEKLTVTPTFYADVAYYTTGKISPRLINLLESGGARRKMYISCAITHFFVGEDPDPDKIEEAKEIFEIPIYSTRWILYSAKLRKILPIHGFRGEKNQLFSGLTFSTSKVKGADLQSVWALVTYHNGSFLTDFTKHCTHLLTNECTGRKYMAAKKSNVHVVCIDWITDSIKAGKLMNEKVYDPALLCSPSLPKTMPKSNNSALQNLPAPLLAATTTKSQNTTLTSIPSRGDNLLHTKVHSITASASPIVKTETQVGKNPMQTSIEQKLHVVDRLNGIQQQELLNSQIPVNHSSQNVTRLVFHQPGNSGQSQVTVVEKSQELSENNFPATTSNLHNNNTVIHNNTVVRIAPTEDQKPQQTQPTLEESQRSHSQQNQSPPKAPHSVQESRLFSNSEQLEIIRQIQSDPQIKLQWAQMDTQQRTLLVQKLAQRNREDRLRREMMIRQQQMQINNLNHQNANSQGQGPKGNSEIVHQQSTLNHSPQTPNQQSTSSRSTVPQNSAIMFQQSLQMRSRFSTPRPQPGFQTPLPNRQPVMPEIRPGPGDQATAQQQQWTIRTQSPHQGGVIYTNQPNMPYAQVVNPKTKTALANLLSNRLMGSATPEVATPANPFSFSYGVTGGAVLSRSPSPQSVTSSPTSSLTSPVQNRVPVQSVKPAQQPPLRRTLSNLTNNDKVPSNSFSMSPIGSSGSPQSATGSYSTPSARFFGHEPSMKLPDGGFLLGCVFWGAQDLKIKTWPNFIVKYGGEIDSTYNPRVTHVLCETQKFPEFQQCVREGKRLVTLFWLNDVISRRFLSSPSQALHLPLPFTENERPYYGELISMTGFTSEESDRVRAMCTLLGLIVTQTFTKANIGLIAKKPEGNKFLMAREWRKPVVNIQFLNELLFGHTGVIQMIHSPKYQQFNMTSPFSFDVALVVPLMAPWKTPLRVSNESFERFRSLKRPAESSDEEDSAKRFKLELVDEVEQVREELFPILNLPQELPGREIATETLSEGEALTMPPGIFIILTGFSTPMKDLFTEKIMEIGGRVTEDRHVATHLVAKENLLTKKLLTFLCIKDKIMKIEWLRDSYAQKKFLTDESYVMSKAKPGIYEIDYTEILKIPNRNRLFAGLTFFLTPSVNNDEIKPIIEAAGGTFDYQKSLQKVYKTAINTPDSYVVVTCEFDEYLLSGWKSNEGVEKIIVVTKDTIFGWIVTQNVDRMETRVQVSKVPSDLLSLSGNMGVESIPTGS